MLDANQAAAPAADRPRITPRYMTKYEKARVLGTRALQIRCVNVSSSSVSLKIFDGKANQKHLIFIIGVSDVLRKQCRSGM